MPSSGFARTIAVGLIVGTMGATPALAAVCASPRDKLALEARVLQTELVVAALSCNERTRYNSFVTRFKDELKTRGGDLQSFFGRAHGKDATRRLNAFVTELANEASQRTIAYQGDYCGDAVKRFDMVLKLTPKEFGEFAAAQNTAALHGYEVCNSPKMASVKADGPKVAAVAKEAPPKAAAPAKK